MSYYAYYFLWLFGIATLNCIIEVPLTILFFRKYGNEKYIAKISIMANYITNLVINLLIGFIDITGNSVGSYIVIFLMEIPIVIIPEAFIYFKAFNNLNKWKSLKYTFILNAISYGIGCVSSLILS